MKTPKKKRRVITLEDKKKVIEPSEGKSLRELSKQLNMAQSTIMGILKKKPRLSMQSMKVGKPCELACSQ
uniref:HTH psq-type domain-containing protein n=1 Tax=Ditylenchus dipsaci TaxID=166011 RepID=A0A915CQG3_9BILA